MTSEFISRIEGNPQLAKAFSDPEFQRATELLSKDPEAAFRKYSKERPDLLLALREFSGLLGDQLDKLAPDSDADAKGRGKIATTAMTSRTGKSSPSVPIPGDLPNHEKELIRRVQTDLELQVGDLGFKKSSL
jgi:hypothetical protein